MKRFSSPRIRRVALTFLTAVLLAAPLQTISAHPADDAMLGAFDVTDVAADDVLNVRDLDAASDISSAPIVAELAPDTAGIAATGRVRMIDGRLWRELIVGDRRGWASSAFLSPAGQESYDLPNSLACHGTEPFWSLRIEDGRLDFDAPDRHATMEERSRSQPVNDRSVTVIETMSDDDAIILFDGACSDGMSDILHPLRIIFLRRGLAPLSGCCAR